VVTEQEEDRWIEIESRCTSKSNEDEIESFRYRAS
jgi:hypothetical protein